MSERVAELEQVLLQPSSLLPDELEAQRLSVLGAEYGVKGDPRTPPGDPPRYKDCRDELGELEAVRRSMLNPYDIHAEYDGPGKLALVRKGLPHGMNEMTVLAQEGYNDKPVDNLFGFAPDVRRSFYEVGASFSEFAEAEGLYPLLSYTYDPQTRDRKPPQSVKTYHLQLTARSDQELAEMAGNAQTLGAYESTIKQRQLIDESSVVYSLALADYFSAYPAGSLTPIAPFTRDSCPNLRFQIGNDWQDILKPEFDKSLEAIHDAVTGLFADFADATMQGVTGIWQRPDLDQNAAHTYIDSIPWMQPETKAVLHQFMQGLRTKHLQRVESLKKLGMTSHVFPVAGLCYGTAINKDNNGNLMLSIRPQFFGEGGGTGLQYLDPINTTVKMTKGSGMYNKQEVLAKQVFERKCAAYIVNLAS